MTAPRLVVAYSAEEASRLDVVVAERLAEDSSYENVSRSQIKNWIESGRVTVNGKPVTKAGAPVKKGNVVEIQPAPPEPAAIQPYDAPLNILFEDDTLIVLDKPFGISMHPGAGDREKTLANAVVAHLRKAGHPSELTGDRPGIVHRLDKDTTGVVVIAKNVAAHNSLSAQFAARTVRRAYRALVFCTPRAVRAINRENSGTVETQLGRHPSQRTKIAVVPEGGKRAVTHWRVVERFRHAALLDVRLETGRTHQIRVHMNHIGSPVIGDKLYGNFNDLPVSLRSASDRFGRQALHAYLLEFEHPVSKKRLEFTSPLPPDFESLVETFRAER